MRIFALGIVTLAILWSAGPVPAADDLTWIEIDGGDGYTGTLTTGDVQVRTLDELIEALSKAKASDVVFIPGNTEIDLTARC